MAIIITVVIYDPENVFLEPLGPVLSEILLIPVVKVPELKFLHSHFSFWNFFGFFLSFFEGFCISEKIIYRFKLLGLKLNFFDLRVFHYNALSLYPSHGNMSKIIALLILVIYLSNIRNRLKACFGLNLDRFLNHFFPSI